MSKIKRPKLKDYLKQSKGQGLGSLINQGVSGITGGATETDLRTTSIGYRS